MELLRKAKEIQFGKVTEVGHVFKQVLNDLCGKGVDDRFFGGCQRVDLTEGLALTEPVLFDSTNPNHIKLSREEYSLLLMLLFIFLIGEGVTCSVTGVVFSGVGANFSTPFNVTSH